MSSDHRPYLNKLANSSLQIWWHCSASGIFQSPALVLNFLPSTIKDSVCEHFMVKLDTQFSRKSIWLLSNFWENALVFELQVRAYRNHGTIQIIQLIITIQRLDPQLLTKFRIQKCLLKNCSAPKTIPKSVWSRLCLKMALLRHLIMIYTDRQTRQTRQTDRQKDRVAVYAFYQRLLKI